MNQTERPVIEGFGVFAPVFQSAHGYLALLHLGADARAAVARVRECCRSTPDPYADIRRLLGDTNWRPHLVATVAAYVLGYHKEVAHFLWHRIDTGSWVTPQLGATLFVIDPDFTALARSRLEACCPLDLSELASLHPLERHSATGPAGSVERSAKAACTLMHLVRRSSPRAEWIDDLFANPPLQALVAQDIDDDSAGITDRWLARMSEIARGL